MTPSSQRPEFQKADGSLRRWTLVSVEQREPIPLGGGQFHPNRASCDRCGQEIRWVATVRGDDGHVIRVGMDCASTLQGGPAEMDLRRAQNAYKWAQYRKAHQAEWAAARAEREAALRMVAEENSLLHHRVMADLAEVSASEKCSPWERDFAGRLLASLRDGSASGDLEMRDSAILRRALRVARAPASAHYGKVGTRVKNVEATLDRCAFMGDFGFGSRWALTFRLDSGEVLVWKTGSGSWCDALAGSKDELGGVRVKMSFTIDAHGEFRGTPQTEVSRVKVEGIGCGYFYINCDAEILRAVDPDFELLRPTWARNLEEMEQKVPGEARIYGPFVSVTELYAAQREDADNDAMIASIQALRAA